MTSLILHYAPDNASLIARLVLEELGLPYRAVLVDRAVKAQDGEAYQALNPAGLIPVLETPDGPIFETAAILLWLSEREPGVLAPEPGSAGRGDFLKWLFFLSNTLHTGLRMSFYPEKYVGSGEAAQFALRETVQAKLTHDLGLLEVAWSCGKMPLLLDFYLGPLLRWSALYPLGGTGWFDLGRYRALGSMVCALEERACMRAAIRAEGLGDKPLSRPSHAVPPEGSAT